MSDAARKAGRTAIGASSKTLGDFKAFLLRGNVVDLAVAVVIGTAFGDVVKAIVSDLITPLLGLIGSDDGFFGDRAWHLSQSTFPYGHLLNTVASFVIVSAVVFFFVVKPVNRLLAVRKSGANDDSLNRQCPYCLSSIPSAARRCAFCTSEVGATQ